MCNANPKCESLNPLIIDLGNQTIFEIDLTGLCDSSNTNDDNKVSLLYESSCGMGEFSFLKALYHIANNYIVYRFVIVFIYKIKLFIYLFYF